MTNPELPQNREAEEALIGSVMIDPDTFASIDLPAEAFYIHRNQWIWQAFIDLRDAHKPIDPLTVSDALEANNQLQEIGGAGYLNSMLSVVPSSQNAEAYSDMVRDCWHRRTQLAVANELAVAAYNGGADIPAIVDKLTRTSHNGRGAELLTEGLGKAYDYIQARMGNPGKVWGIPTGFVDLDEMTGGLHPQQTTLIVGAPAIGKTRLLMQMCVHVALELKRHVVLYELEMDIMSSIFRFINMAGGPTPWEMQTGYVPEEKVPLMVNAIESLNSPYLHFCDNPVMTTSQLRADIARLKSRHPVELVGLDYMNLLGDSDARDDLERARLRSCRFRAICREMDVCGVSIQSLNKEGMSKVIADKQDVSGPAEVMFDADWCFAMGIDKNDGDITHLVPIKDRHAEKKGAIKLTNRGLLFGNHYEPKY